MNYTMKLNLNSIDKEYLLVRIMNRSSVPAELSSGRWVVNPRSLLGVASLDLTKTVTLTLYDLDERLMDEIREAGLEVVE